MKYLVTMNDSYNLEALTAPLSLDELETSLRELERQGDINSDNAADVQVWQLTDITVEVAGLTIRNLPEAPKPATKKRAKG